jgi:hypothetical protein
MSLLLNGTNGVTYNDGTLQSSAPVGRNRIINGNMVIDQRNAGASITPTNGQYGLDRWRNGLSVASKFSVQQNAASVTPPTGFINYLGVTSLAATTVSASDYYFISQQIEGLNTYDLDWGKATAKTVTLSFWVRSSLTGTFGGGLRNSASSSCYPFSYTISTANTWTQISVTIVGDTSGTWLTTNGAGIHVIFGLGIGTTYSTTAGAWAAGNYASVTGATSVVGTSGATFYITGVQLETGTTATDFEHLQYGTQLALCQRYYTKISATSSYTGFATGMATSTTAGQFGLMYPTTMRANPTIAFSNVGINNPSQTSATLTGQFTGNNSAMVQFSSTSLTTNQALVVNANNNASAYIDMSSEL